MGIENEEKQELEKFELEKAPGDHGVMEEGKKSAFRQYYTAASAHIGALTMATVWSYSSTALPSLRESHETLGHITIWEEAWVASITFLAGAIGGQIVGVIAQKVGLKKSLLIAAPSILVGWLLIIFAPNMTVILVGRFITGFWVAGVGVSGSLVAELSHPLRRGRLNVGFDLLFCVGVLYIYIVGAIWGWRVQAGACAAICVLFFGLLLTIPESPRHLISRGETEACRKALKWIRDTKDVEGEIGQLTRSVKEEQDKQGDSPGCKGQCETYVSSSTLKPVLLAMALQFFLQVSGVVPIVCYAVDVFKAAGNELVDEKYSTILLGVVNLGATIIALFYVDKHGRRILWMVSELVLTVTLLALGIFLQFKDSGDYSKETNGILSTFPVVCIMIYITGYSFGVGPLPWVIMGEIFAPSAKGFSNGLVIVTARVFGFFVMFFFKDMMLLIGQHGVYYFFSAVCASGLVFAYFFIPETKNKTLDEIQEMIQGRWLHHRTK